MGINRDKFFLTPHAEDRFRQRVGEMVFNALSRQTVCADGLNRAHLAAMANAEIARGERVYGEARMHTAASFVQRTGSFEAEYELVAFDHHGWVVRDGTIVTFYNLNPAVLQLLGWPEESMRIIAHKRVSDEAFRARLLGEDVTSEDELEDAFRQVIRKGVRIPSPEGVARFTGPFEAKRLVNGVIAFQPITVSCDVVAGQNGNIVVRADYKSSPFVAKKPTGISMEDRPRIPKMSSRQMGRLSFVRGETTYRIELGSIPLLLARAHGSSIPWADLLVSAVPEALMLTETGLEQFFSEEVKNPNLATNRMVGFAFPVSDLELSGMNVRTIILLGFTGKNGTGQFQRYCITPLSPSVLARLKYAI